MTKSRPEDAVEVFPRGSPPALALESALGTLAQAGLPMDKMWLGGGAVLAARWGHRQDSSVNLFVHEKDVAPNLRDGLPEAILPCLPEHPPPEAEGMLGWARWETGHGRAGIFLRSPQTKPWLAEETEATQGIPLERTASILRAKMDARFWNTGEILDRDLHDLAVCAFQEPESLPRTWNGPEDPSNQTLSQEILFLDRIAPKEPGKAGEALSQLRRTCTALLLEGPERFISEIQRSGPEWLGHVPSHPREYPEPGTRPHPLHPALAPLGMFKHPAFLEEAPFVPERFVGPMGKNMAGIALKPKAEEYRDWLRTGDPADLPPGAVAYIGEHLSGLNPVPAMQLRQNCGASLQNIACMAHAGEPQGWLFRGWLNRYAWRAAGDMREEVEGYRTLSLSRGRG